MADAIVTRESIARQANQAAKLAAADPRKPRPPNPYCEHLQPEHHREWNASFERQLQWHLSPEGEGSA